VILQSGLNVPANSLPGEVKIGFLEYQLNKIKSIVNDEGISSDVKVTMTQDVLLEKEDVDTFSGIIANQKAKDHVHEIKANPSMLHKRSSHPSRLNMLRAGDRAYFGWSDVSFNLSAKAAGKAKKDPRILRNQRGVAVPGEVMAIMGASGCGKTSLLNVLSGRIVSMNGHEVKGNFSINGVSVKPENLGPKVAFVTQEDTLCPTATPREALDFSARLRLPPSVSHEERKRMVDEAIQVLRLEKCADSTIGDDMIRGISGGEKR
jgi:ABC-type glutathione transport system ATPase component